MKRPTDEEIQDTLFQFAAQHNLSLIINFHNELRASLVKRVAEIDESLKVTNTPQRRNSLKAQREYYGEVFEEMLRCTTFLLMYAHAEEWFYLIWRTYAPTCELSSRGGSIRRFSSVLKDGLGLDLSKDKNWQFLCEGENVRDCMLHANGRVSLMKKPEQIREIVQRRETILRIANDRLHITGGFLNKFRKAMDAVIAVTKPTVDSA